jgi:hypothetical protein
VIYRGLLHSEYSAYLWAIMRADERTRTADLLITSELLYQLSYVGLLRAQSISQGCPAFTQKPRGASMASDTKDKVIMTDEEGKSQAGRRKERP